MQSVFVWCSSFIASVRLLVCHIDRLAPCFSYCGCLLKPIDLSSDNVIVGNTFPCKSITKLELQLLQTSVDIRFKYYINYN